MDEPLQPLEEPPPNTKEILSPPRGRFTTPTFRVNRPSRRLHLLGQGRNPNIGGFLCTPRGVFIYQLQTWLANPRTSNSYGYRTRQVTKKQTSPSWYKWLWSRIGGRPWTYITRDSYHELPLVWICSLLAIGSVIGWHFGMIAFLKFIRILLLGVLFGHFFWGSRWIRDQKGD